MSYEKLHEKMDRINEISEIPTFDEVVRKLEDIISESKEVQHAAALEAACNWISREGQWMWNDLNDPNLVENWVLWLKDLQEIDLEVAKKRQEE